MTAAKPEPLDEAELRALREYLEPLSLGSGGFAYNSDNSLARLLATIDRERAARVELESRGNAGLSHLMTKLQDCEAERDAAIARAEAAERKLAEQTQVANSFIELEASAQAKLAEAVEALETLGDGACNSRYGPGCDNECKRVAYAALARLRAK